MARQTDSSRASGGVRFEYLTLIGVTLAVGAIVGGNWLEGGRLSVLMQLTAFVIVIGGTLGAVLIQTPLRDFRIAMRRLPWVVVRPGFDRAAVLVKALDWSRRARRDGLLALEQQVTLEADELTRKGLQLLVDGLEPEMIRTVMEVEIDNQKR